MPSCWYYARFWSRTEDNDVEILCYDDHVEVGRNPELTGIMLLEIIWLLVLYLHHQIILKMWHATLRAYIQIFRKAKVARLSALRKFPGNWNKHQIGVTRYAKWSGHYNREWTSLLFESHNFQHTAGGVTTVSITGIADSAQTEYCSSFPCVCVFTGLKPQVFSIIWLFTPCKPYALTNLIPRTTLTPSP